MNDKVNLKEWLTFHKDHDQMRNLFYQMDAKMKYIHSRGYYIMNFQPDKIEIGNHDIFFEELGTMTQQDYQTLMNHNIYTLSFLEIASYSDCLDFLKPSFLNEHFEEFIPFLPSDDILYYRSVIQEKKYYYLTDYANVQKQQSSDESKSTGDTNQHQRSLVKATAAGKLYQEEEEHYSNAAFVNVVVLSSFVVASTLITLLTVMLFALK